MHKIEPKAYAEGYWDGFEMNPNVSQVYSDSYSYELGYIAGKEDRIQNDWSPTRK